MKLILVPMWLEKVIQCNGLNNSHLLDVDALSPYLSKKDLLEYARLPHQAVEYFNERFGLLFPVDGEVGPTWARPIQATEQTTLTDRITASFNTILPYSQQLIGHFLPPGYHVAFRAETFITKESEEVIGVFARLCNDATCIGQAEDARFMEELTGILYARNHSLQDLRADGVLEAYINHVG